MGFMIKIKGKSGLFKKSKSVNMNEILKRLGLEFGYYNDAYVLQLGKSNDNTCIVFNPKCIGRGIYMDLRKLNDDNEITLSYNIPTTKTEINDFFMLAQEIINDFGKVELYNDDDTFTVDSFFYQKEDMIDFSLANLNEKSTVDYKYILTLAMFPYTLSDEEKSAFSKTLTLDEFEKRLHEVQLLDAYYAKPNLYHDKSSDTNIAVYTLTAECESIFPLDGSNSLITARLNTEIDVSWIRFYIYSEDRLIDGHYDYGQFIELVKEKSQVYFDIDHIIIPSLSVEEITTMVKFLKENGHSIA